MTSQIRRILAVLTAFAATISACQTSQAAPVVWSGAGTDMNWSTSANWFGGTPPGTGDDVKFFDLGGGGGFGVVDNIVDINSTNLSLQFANTNNAIVHTTQINPGVTLMLTGSGGLINGNEQSNDTRVTNSITGVGGTLIVSNTAANIQVRQPFNTASTANRTALDMSGLDTFNATVARLLVGVAGSGAVLNRATGRLLLARTNVITTSGAAPQVDISDSNGGSNNGNGSTISLGQTNTFFTDSITVGRARESASTFNFNSAFSSPGLFVRGTNGLSSRVSSWTVGDAATQTGTITARGTVNLSIGTLDAMVDTLILAQPSIGTGDGSQSQGTFIMGAGTLDVNTLILGNTRTNNATTTAAVLSLTGNSTLIVNSNLMLTRTSGGVGGITNSGILNVTNSLVAANTITNAGNGTNRINLVTSTLIITNTAGTVAQPIGTFLIANSTLQLNAVSGTPAIAVNNLSVNGSSDVINISSAPPGAGQYPLIVFTTLGNQPLDFITGTLPAGLQGYISNNTSSVDLVVTNSAIKTDTWRGNVNGNWDTSTLNWVATGAVAYQQNDPVVFDDTLTGTPNVTLTTALTPASTTVNNSSANYTFGGAGKISGTSGIVKGGTSSLTLNETGGDDFTGGILVTGGTLILDNANSAILGGLSIASGASVQVGNNDANGNIPSTVIANDGMLIVNRADNVGLNTAISGNGSLVKLGNGVLTLSNASTYFGDTAVLKGTLALAANGSVTNSGNLIVSNATVDLSGLTRVTTLNNGSINDSAITLNASNTFPSVNFSSLSLGGSANTINISALPGVASYPATIDLIHSAGGVGGFNAVLGSLPAGSTGSIALSPDTTTIQLTLTSGPIGTRPSVLWVGADVPNLNLNWSDRLNWQLPGAPSATDNAIFNGTAVVSDPFTIDNIVDANMMINTLRFTNFVNGQWHVTSIPNDVTLTVNSNLTIGGLTQDGNPVTLAAMTGGGTLAVSGTPLNIGNTGPTANSSGTTLDLSGLSNFVYNVPTGTIAMGIGTRSQAHFKMANGSNYITAATFNDNTASSSSSGTGNLTLGGGTNIINVANFNISAGRASSTVTFSDVNGGIRVRGVGGTDNDRATMNVGNRNNGGGSGNSITGTLSLNGHPVDMKLSTLTLGTSGSNPTGTATGNGVLSYDAGIIDVNSIVMAVNTGTTIGVQANGTINQGTGGTLIVGTGGINLGSHTSAASGASTGTLNIGGTALISGSIFKATNSVIGNITVSSGGSLSVSGTIGTAATPIDNFSVDTATLTLNVNGATPITNIVVTNFVAANITTINIGSIASITAPATVSLISYAPGTADPFGNLVLGTLPTGAVATLQDNTANSTIDLNITTVPAPPTPPTIGQISIVGGNIVISGTNNSGAGGTFHVLTSTNISLPLTNWSILTNSTFDSNGNFNTTNAIDATKPNGFYILQVP